MAQFDSGSIPAPGIICGLSLLLVLVLGPRGFSPGNPVFSSPQKPTFSNSNSIMVVSPVLFLFFPPLSPYRMLESQYSVTPTFSSVSLTFCRHAFIYM